MYICLCKAVTDKDIHRAVSNGASTMRCLRQQNGVGSQCGRCVGHAKEVLSEALSEQADHAASVGAAGVGSGLNGLAGHGAGGVAGQTGLQKEPTTIATAPGVGVCYP